MVFLFGLSLALTSLQADETYTCRYVRPSHMLSFFTGKPMYKERTFSVPQGGSDILRQVSADADDVKRTIRLRGVKEDIHQALDFLKQIDVERRKVTSTIRIQSVVDATDARVVSTIKANIPFEIVESESRTKLSVVVRPNADGTYTIFVGKSEDASRNVGIVFRVKGDQRTRLVFEKDAFRTAGLDEVPPGDLVIIDVTVAPAP
ncbi:hypothetical protein EON81_21250 [bacterium]|nr:MAG: hypothetical protein EON81_21250 [bacterium]